MDNTITFINYKKPNMRYNRDIRSQIRTFQNGCGHLTFFLNGKQLRSLDVYFDFPQRIKKSLKIRPKDLIKFVIPWI